jgi:hypothetical protein
MHCKARGKGLRVREYVMMMMRRVPAVSVVPRRNEPVRDLISAVRVCPYPTVPGPGGLHRRPAAVACLVVEDEDAGMLPCWGSLAAGCCLVWKRKAPRSEWTISNGVHQPYRHRATCLVAL